MVCMERNGADVHPVSLPRPTFQTVEMRMHRNTTKHSWPYGKDEYNTLEW